MNASAIYETESDSFIVENESFESVDDPLNADKATGYETILIPQIPRIIEDDHVIMTTGQGETPVLVLNGDHCEELQPFTKYLRLTLASIWNSALRAKFNFCFSRLFP